MVKHILPNVLTSVTVYRKVGIVHGDPDRGGACHSLDSGSSRHGRVGRDGQRRARVSPKQLVDLDSPASRSW